MLTNQIQIQDVVRPRWKQTKKNESPQEWIEGLPRMTNNCCKNLHNSENMQSINMEESTEMSHVWSQVGHTWSEMIREDQGGSNWRKWSQMITDRLPMLGRWLRQLQMFDWLKRENFTLLWYHDNVREEHTNMLNDPFWGTIAFHINRGWMP